MKMTMHKHTNYFCLFILLVLILPISCKISSDSKPLPLDPQLRSGRLANGFSYYLRKNKNPDNKVLIYFAVKAGSLLEDEDQRGIAHFIEHMSFNGTKHFPNNELPDYLEKIGVRIGPDLNASTNPDETIYQLPLPGGNPEILANGLQIVRDWAQDVSFDSAAVAKERQVILEEKRYLKGLKQRIEEQLIPIYTNQSRYGQRLPIGIEAVLHSVTATQIRRFYQDWYRPDLQSIFIVGDIDVDQMEKDIQTKFSSLQNPTQEKERPNYSVDLSGKDQYFHFKDAEIGGIAIEILKKTRRTPLLTTGDLKKRLTSQLLDQLILDRFRQLPFVGSNPISGGLYAFRISVNSKPGETEPAFKSVWLELRRMQEDGFLDSELNRIKKNYLQKVNEIAAQKDRVSSESLIKGYLQHFLTGDIKMNYEAEAKLSQQLLDDITLQDVNKLLKSYLQEGDRDIITKSAPANTAFVPDEATVKSWIEQTYSLPMEAYVDDVSDQPLLAKAPTAGKVTAHQTDPQVGTETFVLSNGVRVIVKKTDFQQDEVLFKGIAEGGASLSSDSDYLNTIHAANIIGHSGVGNYSATQLTKQLAGKKLQVMPLINDKYQGIEGYSTTTELPLALSLIYGYINEPRKDREAFDILIGRTREEMKTNAKSANQVFMDSINYVLSGNNIRNKVQTLKDIDRINLDRVYQIYKERFSHAAGMTFVFVGNIDMDSFKPLAEKYLGSLPNTGQPQYIRDLNIHIPEGHLAQTITEGNNQKASVMLIYSGQYDYSLANSVKMQAIEECLKLALTARLRNREGGTYTPQVELATSKYPKSRFSLILTFDCAIQNVVHLTQAAQEELAILRAKGPTAMDLQKFKASRRLAFASGMKNNAFWLNYLTTQVMNREPSDQLVPYTVLLDKLDVNTVRDAAQHFIQPQKNEIKFVLLPEKK